MLRFTFVYPEAPGNGGLSTITIPFDEARTTLASKLADDPDFAGMNFYNRCFEADDLLDFQETWELPEGFERSKVERHKEMLFDVTSAAYE